MLGVTNHTDALPLDQRDRRWLVVETFADRKDKAYYERLLTMMEDTEALSAIMYELQNRDLGGYSGFSAAPMTSTKETMIEMARNDADSWLIENAANYPLSLPIVTISDVVAAMPANLQRTARLSTTVIPNFLRDNLKGDRAEGQRRLSDGTRVRLWVLRGQIKMIPDNLLVPTYEKGLGQARKAADDTAVDDFGAG
jgi:hypothetical protein